MPIAKISGEGLAAIAFAVLLLWGCIFGERSLARQAYADRVKVMRELRRGRYPTIPVRDETIFRRLSDCAASS